MSNRTQSALFLLIVFFFASGAGLLIYKNYSDYYQQKIQADLETAAITGTSAPANKTLSSKSDQTSGWKTYANSYYGFEFKYPSDSYIGYDTTEQSDKNANSQPKVALNSRQYDINWSISIFKPFNWYNDPNHPATTVIVDNVTCQSSEGQHSLTVVLCRHGNYDYGISYGLQDPLAIQAKPAEFYKTMLATFKFTN